MTLSYIAGAWLFLMQFGNNYENKVDTEEDISVGQEENQENVILMKQQQKKFSGRKMWKVQWLAKAFDGRLQ